MQAAPQITLSRLVRVVKFDKKTSSSAGMSCLQCCLGDYSKLTDDAEGLLRQWPSRILGFFEFDRCSKVPSLEWCLSLSACKLRQPCDRFPAQRACSTYFLLTLAAAPSSAAVINLLGGSRMSLRRSILAAKAAVLDLYRPIVLRSSKSSFL